MRNGAPGGTSVPPGALNAPLFQSIMQRLEAGGRCVVLDLGAAHTETLAVLGRYHCRVEIGDLADGIDALDRFDPEEDPKRVRERVEAALPRKRDEAIDLVLCWDLLNYLKRPILATVMDCIAVRCRRGALAHCLVYYSTPRMPARPGRFVPLDEQRLLNLVEAPAERTAPRYTPEDLSLCMPRYTVERGRLLRNGMQEFLLRL
jgi:hypothetical protein